MNKIKVALIIVMSMILYSAFSQNFIKNFKAIGEMVSIGDTIYFVADDDIHGNELWRSDGTSEGTYIVKDLFVGNSGSNPSSLVVLNNEIYFAASDGIHGTELWKSNGTNEGTIMVANIKSDTEPYSRGSNPSNFKIFNNEVFFIASDDGNDGDLWKTDGTKTGTVKAFETNYIGIGELTVVENSLFFIRYYGPRQLWKYDGVSGISEQLNIDDYYDIAELNSFNNSLYLITNTTYRQNIRLYKLNADNKFTLLKEFVQPQYGDLDIDNFTKVNNDVYFSVRTDFDNLPETDVLWKTDGTLDGTVKIKEFGWDYHLSGSYMCLFKEYKNTLYFRSGSKTNYTMWKSDGTETGTVQVSAFVPSPVYGIPTISNNLLYFGGSNGTYGDVELIKSDGSQTGTSYFANLNPTGSSNPTNLRDVNGLLYFVTNNETLWNNQDNPEIVVKNGWNNLESGQTVSFNTTKAGSKQNIVLTIENTGHKELLISGVNVSGQDFYISCEKSILYPTQKDTLNITFFPGSEGDKKGQITINNNDNSESKFIINLQGTVQGKDNSNVIINDSVNLSRKVDYLNISDTLNLSNCTIDENSPINSVVGNFNIVTGNSAEYTYLLIPGIGDEDNNKFYIKNNSLFTLKTIDFEIHNTIVIRVRAENKNEKKSYERYFVLKVNDVEEPNSFSKCGKDFYNLSYALNDVCFKNDEVVFAVGDNGVIIKSSDSGKNWGQINSGTNASLYKLQFVTSDVAYIIGGYGDILLKTENGGDNWFQIEINNPGYPYINNLFFITKDKGIVIGGGGKIFNTKNGGKSWVYKTVGYDNLNSVFLVNESTGFICGNSNLLMKTTDFGETWIKINMDAFGWNKSFKDIYFTDEKTGYIVTGEGEVLKTTDAGTTWAKVSKVSTDYATNIYFINKNVGFITGGWNWGNIFKTEDSGITWQEIKFEKNGSLSGISFNSNGQKGCIVGDAAGYGSTSEPGRIILNTENSGNTWTSKSFLDGEDDFYDVTFFDNGIGYIFAGIYYDKGTAFKTYDKGITWQQLSFTPAANIKKCHFINKDTIYAIADSVYLTINGGNSWKGLTNFKNNYKYYFVDFQNIYYEYNGKIYKSIDGGTSWNLVYESNNWFTHIYFRNKNTGFVLGYDVIIKTEDGGVTWSEYKHDLSKVLKTIAFVENNTILIGGYDGTLLKSTDNGNSWNKILSSIPTNIIDIEFYDNENGIALTNNDGGLSNIYSTDDQGVTWKFITQISEDTYKAFIYNDETYIVGDRGSFYKYSQKLPPSQASYILGDELVCKGDIIDYSTFKAVNYNYSWEVLNVSDISVTNNLAKINWKNEGQYDIKLSASNECGQGLSQILTVKVDGLPNPIIVGKDTVSQNASQVIYSSNEHPEYYKLWHLIGNKTASVLNENEISVNWGNSSKGIIELIQTTTSGCRQKATKSITILNINSASELNQDIDIKVFPNPSSETINIILPYTSAEKYIAKIYSNSGVLINSYEILDIKTIINIENYSKGIYILNINNNSTNRYKAIKIIIK